MFNFRPDTGHRRGKRRSPHALPIHGVRQQRRDGLVQKARVRVQHGPQLILTGLLLAGGAIGSHAATHATAAAQGLQVDQGVQVPGIHTGVVRDSVHGVPGQRGVDTLGDDKSLGPAMLAAVVGDGHARPDHGADQRTEDGTKAASPPDLSGETGDADQRKEAAHAPSMAFWVSFAVCFGMSFAISLLISGWQMRRFERQWRELQARLGRES